MITGSSRAAADAYRRARQDAGLARRQARGRIVVSGADRRAYLHGLLTNDIAALTAGTGCYAAYLTAQGRMIADLWVYELGDVVLISLGRDIKDTVIAKLDQFIFSEDVQLGDVTDTFASELVIGPNAARCVAAALNTNADAVAALPINGNLRATFGEQPVIVLRVDDVGETAYELVVDRSAVDALEQSLRARGAGDVDAATLEVLRVEGGVPLFHRDMDEETIPLEAGIESRAISLTKGCYVGQEVIIRVLHRGHGRVAKRLVGVTIDGSNLPDRGAPIHADGREVGHVTSSVWSPALERPVALGYVHRDFVEPGTRVTIASGAATVAALPFVTHS